MSTIFKHRLLIPDELHKSSIVEINDCVHGRSVGLQLKIVKEFPSFFCFLFVSNLNELISSRVLLLAKY